MWVLTWHIDFFQHKLPSPVWGGTNGTTTYFDADFPVPNSYCLSVDHIAQKRGDSDFYLATRCYLSFNIF